MIFDKKFTRLTTSGDSVSYLINSYKIQLADLLFPKKEAAVLLAETSIYADRKDSKSLNFGKISGNVKIMIDASDYKEFHQLTETLAMVRQELPDAAPFFLVTVAPSFLVRHFTECQALGDNKNDIGAPVHFIAALETGLTNDNWYGMKEVTAATLATLKQSFRSNGCFSFVFNVCPANCYIADDVMLLCSHLSVYPVHFLPGAAFLPGKQLPSSVSQEMLFHVVMFFDSLTRIKTAGLPEKLFYRRIVAALGSERAAADRALPKAAKPVSGRGELIVSERPEDMLRLAADYELSGIAPLVLHHFIAPGKDELATFTGNLVRAKFRGGTGPKKTIGTGAGTIPAVSDPRKWKHVVITGWYGTETNGDKAILGEVLHFIKTCSTDCRVTLTTIYPAISIQTNSELEHLKGVRLISIYEPDFSPWVRDADAVIMGGGPLMETSEMWNVLRLFEEGNRQNKARIVFGCGVGPFHTQEIRDVTARVISLTTAGFVRDKESLDYANQLAPGNVLRFACDPAVAFMYRWKKNYVRKHGALPTRQPVVATLLRANTNEFAANVSKEQLEAINDASARQISSFLVPFCEKVNLRADLLHMNAPWVGGDDRLFNRLVEEQFAGPAQVTNERKYLTLDEHIERMLRAGVALAMRYHGHIFSMALGLPFLSIDYTGKKGKVFSLVNRIGYSEWSEEWESMEPERAKQRLEALYAEREKISGYLNNETEKLVALLHKTYEEVFQVELTY